MFRSLSVIENLEMGAVPERGRAEWSRNLEQIFALFPVLKERRDQPAGTLSGGEQQMLAIGRGLASSPRLLLLDEPSMGLAPMLADLIFSRIEEIHRQTGLTVLLVEQRVAEALSVVRLRLRPRIRTSRPRGHARRAARGRAGETGVSWDVSRLERGPSRPYLQRRKLR